MPMMATNDPNDANFCNGRLRLATFLRVVDSDMLQRPRRFRKRVPLCDEEPAEVNGGPVQAHECSAATMSAQVDSPVSRRTSLDNGDAPDEAQSHGETAADTLPSDGHVAPSSEYDIPRSPTPIRPTVDRDNGGETAIGPDGEMEIVDDQTSTETPKRVRKKAAVAQISFTRKAPRESQEFSSTRKRRLPVLGLALLRTTTSDGLPEPGDALNAFASPISQVDPIHDSQMPTSYAHTICRPRLRHQSAMSPAQRSPHQQPRSQVSKTRSLKSPAKPKQSPRVELHIVADGFVGAELSVVSRKKPRRRGQKGPREVKPIQALPTLALSKGSLPPPAVQPGNPPTAPRFTPMRPSQTSTLNDSDSGVTQTFGQLVLTGTQVANIRTPPQHNQAEQRESAIQRQLSSIVAPVRRESASSASEAMSDDHQISMFDDGDLDTEEGTEEPGEPVGYPRRRATFVEDHSYFERAMHGLDVEGGAESVRQDFWSQSNAME